MGRVFISYAREDRAFVDRLASAFELAGHQVWFDRSLEAGQSFRQQISDQLNRADVVAVVWSKRSILSRFVIDEADRAAQRGKLLPVIIDRVTIPLGMAGIHAHDLSSWDGTPDDPRLQPVLKDLERRVIETAGLQERPPIKIVPQAMSISLAIGAASGTLIWLFSLPRQVSYSSILGHPLFDAVVFGVVLALPIVFREAFAARRLGFSKWSVILGRVLRTLRVSGIVALGLTAAGAAVGAASGLAPAEIVSDLAIVAISSTLLIALAITGVRIVSGLFRKRRAC